MTDDTRARMSAGMKRYWQSSPKASAHKSSIRARNSRPTTAPKALRLSPENFEKKYILEPVGLRRCVECGEIKPLEDFWKAGLRRRSRCKQCDGKRQREFRKTYKYKNPEKTNASARRWREAHPETAKLRSAEASRKRRSSSALAVTERDLHRLWCHQSGQCYLCGETLSGREELDHIIPVSKGGRHAIGNLAWACRRCNREKGSSLLVGYRYANHASYHTS